MKNMKGHEEGHCNNKNFMSFMIFMPFMLNNPLRRAFLSL